jgi:hypothetical protein
MSESARCAGPRQEEPQVDITEAHLIWNFGCVLIAGLLLADVRCGASLR